MSSDAVVVLTRATEDNMRLAAELRARGVEVIELPSMTVEALADDTAFAAEIRALRADDRLVFTSRAGVEAARRCVRPDEIRAPVAAVGPATAERCTQWGIDPWMPSEPTGAALGRELELGAGVVLLARAERADAALARELTARGARVREVVAYRVRPGARGDTDAARRAALGGATVLVSSPVAFDGLVDAIGVAAIAHARLLAIGPTTARAIASALGRDPRLLHELTADAILRELEVEDVAHR
jgi:uroporphyrinogen-III synthase